VGHIRRLFRLTASKGSADTSALSKAISLALRHEPWIYELEPDGEGWVDIEMLVAGLQQNSWPALTSADVVSLVASAETQRHEIANGRIRAIYGHSLGTRISHPLGAPPEALFHGTSPAAVASIRAEGLRPMGRQYVHMSVDAATAIQVGRRKARDGVVLLVAADEAFKAGTEFYQGNDRTWLAHSIPAKYITQA
jgi:putative RNA 2'-phosphotransferase